MFLPIIYTITKNTENRMIEVKRQKLKKIINASVISLVILLMLYFFAQLLSGGVQNISTVRTQNITDSSYINLDGYVVRDEHLIYAESGYVAEFLVGNGERVGVNKEYIRYHKTNLDGFELDNAQSELNKYTMRIDILENSLSGHYTVSDVDAIRNELGMAYSSLLGAVSKGDYSDADLSGETMLGAINDYNAATGKEGVANESLSEIKAKKQKYIENISSGNYISKTASQSCFVYMDTDGYENVFDYSEILQLTPDELSLKIKEATPDSHRGAVGKIILNSEWFYAVPINASQMKHFEEGDDYELVFVDDGEQVIKMTVEKIYAPKNNIGKGLIIFSSRDIALGANISRYTSVKVCTGSVSGYKVPEDAVTEIDYDGDGIYDYVGVYVLSGNRVEFRRVETIGRGAGYVIVKTQQRYEADLEEKKNRPAKTTEETTEAITEEGESTSGEETTTEKKTAETTEKITEEIDKEEDFPYLSLNELIIISGGGELYDGKILK